MSEFDDLERQLRRSVRALAPRPPERRRSRRRGSTRLLALLTVPLALAGGAAGAAALVGGGPGTEERAERLAQASMTSTRLDPACRFPTGAALPDAPTRLVDGAIAPEILRAVPSMRDASSAPDDRTALALVSKVGPRPRVLRGSVREERFPDGGRLAAFVEVGPTFGVPDARRCTAARRRAVVDLAARGGEHRDDPVTRRAVALVQRRPDTDPQLQTLWLQTFARDSVGAAGVRVRPGRPLSRGIVGWGGSATYRQVTGIAAPGATAILVRAAPGSRRARSARLRREVRRRVVVRSGFFVFSEPGPVGRLLVEHRDATGRVLFREHTG
jgi:hypothetical protein